MPKQRLLFIVFSMACIYIVLTASSNGRATAANADNTGAPSSTQTCGGCHSGGSYGTVNTLIEIFTQGTSTPVTAYTAGSTYDMKLTITTTSGTPAGYGFQLTCLTSPGNSPVAAAGTYTNLSSNVKQKQITIGTFNGRLYLEHNGVTASNVFTFRWTAPSAGTGTVKFYACGNAVNGANGDNGDKASVGVSLTLPESAPLSVTGVTTNVSCNGGTNGAINITATGGSAPYTYNWGAGLTSEDRTGLSAGNYSVTVTDNLGATASGTFSITQPAALAVSGTVTNVLCNGGNNGAINITASGGTPVYSYNWGSGITTEDRTAIPAGNYAVTVTDSKSCTASSSFSVTQPNALVASNTHGTINCFGGNTTINVTASGGTSPYNGTGSFTVVAGNYSYTVTDANGCSSVTAVTIAQPQQLVASANDIAIPCNGGSGTVTVTASGGVSPYTGTGNFTVTTPGIQTYPVSDANGCTASATSNVSSTTGLSVSATTTGITCNAVCNGTINTTITGGTQPYTYSWSNSAGTEDLNNLCAGVYVQTVSDNANCSVVNTYVVQDIAPLSIVVNQDSITCFGNSANVDLSVTGGLSPYTYTWTSGGNTSGLSLTAGSYTVTITDNNGCTAVQNVNLSQPDSIQIILTNVTNDDGMGNGAIDVTVTGGTSPYSYNWSNASTTEDIAQLSNGSYILTVTDANNCATNTSAITILNTSLEEISTQNISVYPNPFNDILMVSSSEPGNLSIYNTQGVLEHRQDISAGQNVIDLSGLAPNVFVAFFSNGMKINRLRLVKQQ